MAYFNDFGALSFISPGESVTWVFGWGDFREDVMCIAGPDLDRNGSAGAMVWATQQGKQLRIDGGPVRHEFFVTLRSDGPSGAYYNLQIVTFP